MSLASRSAKRSRRNLTLALAVAAAVSGMSMVNNVSAAWIGANTGATQSGITYRYDRTSNWAGGVYDDTFNGALAGNTSLYFGSDYATVGDMSFTYTGNFGLTLLGGSTADGLAAAARTLTLNGNIIHTPVNGGALTFGSTTATQALNVNLNGTRIFFAGDNTTARTINLTNVVSNGTLIKAGIGQLNLSGVNTYIGATVIGLGTTSDSSGGNRLTLQSSGTLASTNITALFGGRLRIDQGTGAAVNRLVNTADVNLIQGTFEHFASGNNTGIVHNEVFGNLNVVGLGYIVHGFTGTPAGTNNTKVTSTFALNRQNGGFINVTNANGNAANLDTNPSVGQANTSGTDANNKIVLTNGASLLVGGGGAAGTTNVSVIPYVVGAELPPAANLLASLNAKTFYTYDANLGLRPLARTTEYQTSLGSAGTTDNVRLSVGPISMASATTINSLVLSDDSASPGTLTLSNTLTVQSGAILISNTGGNWTVTGGTIRFGGTNADLTPGTVDDAREGFIIIGGGRGANINSALVGTMGATFVVTGSGSAADFRGDWTGLSGTLHFTAATFGISQASINGANTLVGHDVVVGSNVILNTGSLTGSFTSRVNSIGGGSENVAAFVRINDGTNAGTLTNRDRFVIGGSGALVGASLGRFTLDGGTVRPGLVSDGTTRWTRLGNLQLEAATATLTGLDVKSGNIEIDLGEATKAFTRVAPTNTSLKGVSDRIIVNGDINLATAATLKLTTWSGSGVGPGSYLVATASGGVTNTMPLTIDSTGLGSTLRAKADYGTTNQIWVDVLSTANHVIGKTGAGTFALNSGTTYDLDFGSLTGGDPSSQASINFSNLLREVGVTLQEGLKVTGISLSGAGFSLAGGTNTALAGSNVNILVDALTSGSSGSRSGTLTFNLSGYYDDGSTVFADRSINSYTINLASTITGGGSPIFIFQDTTAATINVLKGSNTSAGALTRNIENNGTASGDASLNSVTNLAVTHR